MELVATRPTVWEMLQGVLQSDTKDIDQTSKSYREIMTLIEVYAVLCCV